eukprot:6205184-Pleurochrysis_carterae.AAC.3
MSNCSATTRGYYTILTTRAFPPSTTTALHKLPSELEIQARDELKCAKLSNVHLWKNFYPNEVDGIFDPERIDECLAANNERYMQGRQERTRIKKTLERGNPDEFKDLRSELSDDPVTAQHYAARDLQLDSYGDIIRRFASWLTRLDKRERELGLPLSNCALVDRPSPVRTLGFRGYFARDSHALAS